MLQCSRNHAGSKSGWRKFCHHSAEQGCVNHWTFARLCYNMEIPVSTLRDDCVTGPPNNSRKVLNEERYSVPLSSCFLQFRDGHSSFYPEGTKEPVQGSKDTEPEGDTHVAPGSGFPWTLAAFLRAWVLVTVTASGFLSLRDTGSLCCSPESNAGALSLRDCFVQKPETRSQRRENGNR